MEIIKAIFGEGKDLTSLQMGCRATVVFFIALIMIRLAGMRTFGKKSAFDNIISIMLGAILSRTIVGASEFLPTITACLVLVLIHWLLAWLSLYSKSLSTILKGEKRPLFEDGKIIPENMKRSLIDEKDLMESVRLGANVNTLDKAEKVYMEGSGQISVIKKASEK